MCCLLALRKCYLSKERSLRSANCFDNFALFLPGGNSDAVPPDPIPNSEVKRISGDGSVGFPHVRVAHRQAPILRKGYPQG